MRRHAPLAFALLLLGALPGCTTLPDTSRTLDRPSDQPWQGFGVEWDPTWWQSASQDSGYDSAGWRLALERIDSLGPTPVRMMLHLRWFVQDSTLATWNWSSPNARAVLRQLDALKSRNIPVLVCEWGWAIRRGSGEQIFSRPMDTLYARGIAQLLKSLVVERHYDNIRWYSIGNEPESEMRSRFGDAVWINLTRSVQTRLDGDSVPLERLATEEGVGHGLSDPTSRNMLDGAAIAGYHAYSDAGTFESLVRDRTVPEGMPFWLTEANMSGGSTFTHPDLDKPSFGLEAAALGLAAMRKGASAVLYWSLHDAVYDFMPRTPMCWGMWAGPKSGWKLRPWIRAFSLLTRAVPAGSRLTLPASVPVGVRAIDISRPDGGRGFVAANISDDTVWIPRDSSRDGIWIRRIYLGRIDPGGGILLPEDTLTVSDRIALPPRTLLALRR